MRFVALTASVSKRPALGRSFSRACQLPVLILLQARGVRARRTRQRLEGGFWPLASGVKYRVFSCCGSTRRPARWRPCSVSKDEVEIGAITSGLQQVSRMKAWARQMFCVLGIAIIMNQIGAPSWQAHVHFAQRCWPRLWRCWRPARAAGVAHTTQISLLAMSPALGAVK